MIIQFYIEKIWSVSKVANCSQKSELQASGKTWMIKGRGAWQTQGVEEGFWFRWRWRFSLSPISRILIFVQYDSHIQLWEHILLWDKQKQTVVGITTLISTLLILTPLSLPIQSNTEITPQLTMDHCSWKPTKRSGLVGFQQFLTLAQYAKVTFRFPILLPRWIYWTSDIQPRGYSTNIRIATWRQNLPRDSWVVFDLISYQETHVNST